MILITLFIALVFGCGSTFVLGTYLLVVGGEMMNYIVGAIIDLTGILLLVLLILLIKEQIKDIMKEKKKND